jgi:hypothetical protein
MDLMLSLWNGGHHPKSNYLVYMLVNQQTLKNGFRYTLSVEVKAGLFFEK